jgi:exosome complex component RRP43
MEIEAFRKLHPAEFYRKFLVHSVRPDGRNLSKARKTTVTSGTQIRSRFVLFSFFFFF